jgi:hypothetical protein
MCEVGTFKKGVEYPSANNRCPSPWSPSIIPAMPKEISPQDDRRKETSVFSKSNKTWLRIRAVTSDALVVEKSAFIFQNMIKHCHIFRLERSNKREAKSRAVTCALMT